MLRSFPPRLSDHFPTVHLACTQNLLQMKEQKQQLSTRGNASPLQEREKKKENPSSSKKKRKKARWLYSYQVFWFGFRPRSWDAGSPGNSRRRRRRHKRCDNQARSSGVEGLFPPSAPAEASSQLVGSFCCKQRSGKELTRGIEMLLLFITIKSATQQKLSSAYEVEQVRTKDGPVSDDGFVHTSLLPLHVSQLYSGQSSRKRHFLLCTLFPFTFRNPLTIVHRLTRKKEKKEC